MSLNEERLRILKMVQEGKLTAEEGANLMEILENPTSGEAEPRIINHKKEKPEEKETGEAPRFLLIKVTDKATGKEKVNLRLPLGVTRMIKSLIPVKEKEKLLAEGIDLEELLSRENYTHRGPLLEVDDSEDGDRVEIFLD